MKRKVYSIIIMCIVAFQSLAQSNLLKEFNTPPNAAKPRVWWHWMNGNITKDGIQKDLEWMERIGIGGFQNFDASLFTPVVVPKKLIFMTPEWKDAFKFTTQLADKKGLEMAIAGSPGWSVTGGTWVKPEDAMKKYVWTETRIEGGKPIKMELPRPSSVTGKFQNVGIENAGIMGGFIGTKPVFYSDAAVIAYKLPSNDISMIDLKPIVSSSGGTFTLEQLSDGDLNKTSTLPPKKAGEEIWIQYTFENPQTIKAFSISGANHLGLEDFNGGPENRSLQYSVDGINFTQVANVSGSIVPQNTVSFAPVTAKYFRLVYKTLESETSMFALMAGLKPEPPKPMGVDVAEFVLHTSDRIDRVEDKAGFTPWKEDTKSYIATIADASDISIDISKFMDTNGNLNWTAPAGSWLIIRFGYSLTGRQNHPASPEATGLEVDKLDKIAVKKYINTYLDMYKDATEGMMGVKGLKYMILDSYEAGHMTWSPAFPAEFKNRRGYDIMKWIPVLTGRIIKSADASEKFLWDFRKTIGELIAENHYDVIGEELHKRGMKRYTESHEDKRIYLADGMDVKRNSDIPMSAMWTPGSLAGGTNEEVRSEGDIRESASVANIYGKSIVAAESMTSVGRPFMEHPERLKRTADLELASGLNRFVIHTSVHQALDDKKPGCSLGPFGQYFTRHETWSKTGGKAWINYLARSSHMLQQGRNIADILYYYGENTNITWLTRNKLPDIPAGYEFDFVNSSALINAISMKNGVLTAKSGNTYKLLVLDETAKNMTLSVLKKLQLLVMSGAKITGTKPKQSPSLSDNQTEFKMIVDNIWKHKNVFKTSTAEALKTLKATEDIIIKTANNKILYRHRKTLTEDIFWLNNRGDNPTNAEVSFKISGKIPELWNPQTGTSQKLSYQNKEGRTIVPLSFESWGAYFIIFKEITTQNNFNTTEPKETPVLTINTPWSVKFGQKTVMFDTLKSWSKNNDKDIKYFSGTAAYTNTFNMVDLDKAAYLLDLGDVKNVAEVIINGKNVGTVWKKPFKIDITEGIQKGENTITINVSNLWVNRLVGDAQLDTKEKTTFTTMPFYRADSPILPSGLLTEIKLIKSK